MTAQRRPYVAPVGAQRVWLINPAGVETMGWFLITLRKDGRPVPASILMEPSARDAEWLRPIYRLLGAITDRRAFEGKAGRAITQAEHDYQVELWTWGKKHKPAEFDPHRPYDVASQPSIF